MNLLFVGDVMLGRLVNWRLRKDSTHSPWGNTLPHFQAADVRICNLECVIADGGERWQPDRKTFHFRTDAKNISVLQEAAIDSVSIANNHALDYGAEALLEMLDILDQTGIQHAGAGANAAQAVQPARFSQGGLEIGMLAFTDNMPLWEASSDQPGVWYAPIDLERKRAKTVLQAVQQVKETVDFLIVSAHWGPNWGHRPRAEHVRFGRALVEAGADLIFGHSCHVFQGIEVYQGQPILYSCGDFVDDYRVNEEERNDQSFLFNVVVDEATGQVTELQLRPTYINDFQAHLAQGDKAAAIADKMKMLCAEMGTSARWDAASETLIIALD